MTPIHIQACIRLVQATVAGAALLILSGCAMTFVDTIPSLPEDVHAPVVAVTSFDNRSGFEGQWKLGDGMADLLVTELIRSRNYTVVERQHFENLVGEINRQKSGLFRPEGKTPTGRMKGAQYLIRGVINDFSQAGGGGLSVAILKFILLGRGHKARVSLTLTLVDIETGQVTVTRYVVMHDCGTVINPDLAAGQLEGGLNKGAGYALLEGNEWDPQGQLLSKGYMADAKIPGVSESPRLDGIATHFADTYEPSGPFGAKGLGELPFNGPAPAIVNALRHLGLDVREIPVLPEHVMEAAERSAVGRQPSAVSRGGRHGA
jgi:hypothetical protein